MDARSTKGTTMDEQETGQRKPFAAVLQEMRKGGLHTEMGDELASLIVTCMETQKKGTLTLTLSVSPKGEIAEIADKVVVKAPRPNTLASIFWPDTQGNLSLSNPNQLDIGSLREIKGGKTDEARELKDVGS